MNLKTGLLIGTNPKNFIEFFKSSVHLKSLNTLYVKLVSNAILEALLLNSKQNITSSKTLPEFIDDCDMRIAGIKDFLFDVQPHLEYNIVPINDIYGPTKEDASLQMIVVSKETVRGGEKINEYRKANGLSTLDVIQINLIEALRKSDYEESKISSSTRRMRLLGALLKPPTPKPNLPAKPYIIGLTGGIASGKSSVLEHFKNLGCGCINCDSIAHRMYDIGSTGYQFILNEFGPSVLNEDGCVNRKQLGNVVFNDKEKLNQLNNGLWPLVLNKVKEEIRSLHRQNKEVIVIEAALLIQANWTDECHEIWSCIISPQEAIKRLQVRNRFTIEEAQTRINSQPTNKEYISYSNVVFCSYWDANYTKYQVEKAWSSLKNRVAISS